LYREAWEESLTLPKLVQAAFLEDALTDILATGLDGNLLTSPQEGEKYVQSTLPEYIELNSAVIASGLMTRIVVKLLMFSFGKPVPMDGVLQKLTKSLSLTKRDVSPLVQLYEIDKKPFVVIATPNVNLADPSIKRALDLIVTFAHYCIGVPVENIKVASNPSFGTEFRFDSVILKLLEELSASASSPSGAYPGGIIKVNDYTCNLPTILASLHLMNLKGNFLRVRSPRKGEKVVPTTAPELRNLFNTRSGLGKSDQYSVRLVKQLLLASTSARNRRFPGGWILSNRQLNNVKSDTGLIAKLGYVERVPYHHKLVAVLNTRTTTNPAGKRVLRAPVITEDRASFMEYRLGVVMSLPKLDSTSKDSFDKQIKVDPMSCKDPGVLKSFGDTKYHKAINTLNKAHAMLVSVPKGGSKTKAIHYEIVRNELLHLSDRVPIKDSKGNLYESVRDIPVHQTEYLSKTFRFSTKSKRELDTASSEQVSKKAKDVSDETLPVDGDPMVIDQKSDRHKRRPRPQGVVGKKSLSPRQLAEVLGNTSASQAR
jgi:hypothetical protein